MPFWNLLTMHMLWDGDLLHCDSQGFIMFTCRAHQCHNVLLTVCHAFCYKAQLHTRNIAIQLMKEHIVNVQWFQKLLFINQTDNLRPVIIRGFLNIMVTDYTWNAINIYLCNVSLWHYIKGIDAFLSMLIFKLDKIYCIWRLYCVYSPACCILGRLLGMADESPDHLPLQSPWKGKLDVTYM